MVAQLPPAPLCADKIWLTKGNLHGKKHNIKLIGTGIIKIIAFIISIQLLQELIFIPLIAISSKYWSQYDGRGLNEPWFLTSAVAILLVTLLVCFVFIKFIDKKDWSYIRFLSDYKLKLFLIGVSTAFIIVVLFTTILIILNDVELTISLKSTVSIIAYLAILPIGLFTLVLYEELVYRGYVLKTLERLSNPFVAIIASSLLFSVFHMLRPNVSLVGFLNIFLLGSFLAMVCIYYNNLWIPTGLHFGWNFFFWFFNFPVSGQTYPNPIFNLHYNEYSLLSGSKFGPEDSLLPTLIIIFLISYLGKKIKEKDMISEASMNDLWHH